MDRAALAVPYSDEWWFERLFRAMHNRQRRRDGVTRSRVDWYDILWGWFEGDPPQAESTSGWKQQITQEVLRMGRANLAQLSVVSLLDRVKITGVRVVDDSIAGEDTDPSSLRSLSRRMVAQYTAQFNKALVYAAVMHESYIWISGVNPLTGLPTVTAEDPRTCVTINDPITGRTVAALKLYRDEVDGYDYAIVAVEPNLDARDDAGNVLVDEDRAPVVAAGSRVRIARRKSRKLNEFSPGSWDWYDDAGSGELPIQGRGVFVHRIEAPLGMGDFEPNLDLLNRINNMIVDRLWISKFQVFRQRAFRDTSQDPDAADPFPEEDEETGEKIDWDNILSADPGAVWRLPQFVDVWESTPTDLQPALLAVRDDIKEYAATSRTPLYVFTPDAADGSAEGATLAREQQVYKAESWQEGTGGSFLDVAADILAIATDAAGFNAELQLQWLPAERFSLLQKTQAAANAKAAGVPWEGRMEDIMQLPPETIARYRRQRRSDLLFDQDSGNEPDPADAALGAAAS